MLDTQNLKQIVLDFELEIDGVKLAEGNEYCFEVDGFFVVYRFDLLRKCPHCEKVHVTSTLVKSCRASWLARDEVNGHCTKRLGSFSNLQQLRRYCDDRGVGVTEHIPYGTTMLTQDEYSHYAEDMFLDYEPDDSDNLFGD